MAMCIMWSPYWLSFATHFFRGTGKNYISKDNRGMGKFFYMSNRLPILKLKVLTHYKFITILKI